MDCGGNNYMTDRIVIAQLVITSHECVGKANVVRPWCRNSTLVVANEAQICHMVNQMQFPSKLLH
jgi:hypothetical protein